MQAIRFALCATTLMLVAQATLAAATSEEAAQLKTTLTPLGAERSANKEGTIPAWTGGYTQPMPGYEPGGRRPDPFASDKPLYSVTAQNLAQHADKISDGHQAMFKKYPNYRIDVYPTRRTAAAPQWVYDNTFRNATQARTANNGVSVTGAYGGIPFPIPKTGSEAMWNHILTWQGEAARWLFQTWIVTADGKRLISSDSVIDYQYPYYYKDGSFETFKGDYMVLRLVTEGPPQKAGEAIVARYPTDMVGVGPRLWQYLAGQRRVRKLPNALYDTPSFVTAGISNFDEIWVFGGPQDRYDWKLVGKKEMLIPYNNNKLLQPSKIDAAMSERFLNPDQMRWELHRVWVVEATLADGKRHVMPKRRFYLDEDTWLAVLADGWDQKGQLWKTFWYQPVLASELPAVIGSSFGHYNLQTGDWIANHMVSEKPSHISFQKRLPDNYFTGEAMAGESVR